MTEPPMTEPLTTEPAFLSTTRASYDSMAAGYAERFQAELAARPLERALLGAFAELVRTAGAGPVADLGCGPGHVTAYLDTLGLNAFGVDLSPEMVALARRAHPGLRFDEGSMTALDLPAGALGGITALYSIIHTPTERLPGVFAEFHRVLAPGGHLLLAVLVGDELRHRTEAFGQEISLDYYLRAPLDQGGHVVAIELDAAALAWKTRRSHGVAPARPHVAVSVARSRSPSVPAAAPASGSRSPEDEAEQPEHEDDQRDPPQEVEGETRAAENERKQKNGNDDAHEELPSDTQLIHPPRQGIKPAAPRFAPPPSRQPPRPRTDPCPVARPRLAGGTRRRVTDGLVVRAPAGRRERARPARVSRP